MTATIPECTYRYLNVVCLHPRVHTRGQRIKPTIHCAGCTRFNSGEPPRPLASIPDLPTTEPEPEPALEQSKRDYDRHC